jgi:hypothetical protein
MRSLRHVHWRGKPQMVAKMWAMAITLSGASLRFLRQTGIGHLTKLPQKMNFSVSHTPVIKFPPQSADAKVG